MKPSPPVARSFSTTSRPGASTPSLVITNRLGPGEAQVRHETFKNNEEECMKVVRTLDVAPAYT